MCVGGFCFLFPSPSHPTTSSLFIYLSAPNSVTLEQPSGTPSTPSMSNQRGAAYCVVAAELSTVSNIVVVVVVFSFLLCDRSLVK